MAKQQKTYTREFKLEAVRLVKNSGKPMSQIARELLVSDSALYRWCQQLAEQGEQAFPGSGHQTAEQKEIRRLKRELEVTRQERDILKSSQHLLTGVAMNYQFIAAHRQEYPIKTMCRVLEVAESGFYAWLRRAPSRRSQENTRLGEHIMRNYHANQQVYGSPRIHAVLQAEDQRCGKKRVARLMRELGLSARPRKHRTCTTYSNHELPVAPNLLNRQLTAPAANTKWVADITAIWTMEGLAVSGGCARYLLTHGRGLGDGEPPR